jgi:hypothetical protein
MPGMRADLKKEGEENHAEREGQEKEGFLTRRRENWKKRRKLRRGERTKKQM